MFSNHYGGREERREIKSKIIFGLFMSKDHQTFHEGFKTKITILSKSPKFNFFLCLGWEECLFFALVDFYMVTREEGRGRGTTRDGQLEKTT